MIQLTKKGFTSQANLESLAREFTERHCIRLPQLLGSDLIDAVSEAIQEGVWIPCQHGEIARELLLQSDSAIGILTFVLNTPEILRAVESITQCGPIAWFQGRVYRMVPGTNHYDVWHDDRTDGNRLVGMSLNLGLHPYSGGVFQLRSRKTHEMRCELPNAVQGDAILFRISNEFEHRITPMKGTEPKTAFAGWFKSGENDYFAKLRGSSLGYPLPL